MQEHTRARKIGQERARMFKNAQECASAHESAQERARTRKNARAQSQEYLMIKRTFRLTSWHCCQTMRQSTTLTFNETSNGKRLLLTTMRATSKLHTVQQAKASTRRKTRSVERGASCTTYRMQSSGANRTLPADKNTHQDTPILAAPRRQRSRLRRARHRRARRAPM